MNEIIVETARLTIRGIRNTDFDLCCQISRENYFPQLWQNQQMAELHAQTLWEEIIEEGTLNGIIVERKTKKCCGRVCMQRLGTEFPEIGIELLKDYQNIGIGTEAVIAFCNWFSKEFAVEKILVRIEDENISSRHMFEKLGAKFESKHSLISEKTLEAVKELFPNDDTTELLAANTSHYYLELPIK